MKKLAFYAAAATVAATAFASPSNAAPQDGPVGRKCGFNSATDVTREAGWQTGVINAGPLVTLGAGTLTCNVVVNGGTHSSPAAFSASVDAVGVVAVMEPRPLNYPATAADEVSLCSVWDPVVGPTLYWVSQAAPNLGYWDDDPSATCGASLSIEPNDPTCSIWLAIDQRAGTNIAEIWQDCEGYGPII